MGIDIGRVVFETREAKEPVMKAVIERRWDALCEAVADYGDHPETWDRAAALAEVQMVSSLNLFLTAWEFTQAKR